MYLGPCNIYNGSPCDILDVAGVVQLGLSSLGELFQSCLSVILIGQQVTHGKNVRVVRS